MANGSMSGCKYMSHAYHGYCGPGFIYIATDGELYKIGCTKEKSAHHHVYKSAGVLAGVVGRLRGLNQIDSERQFDLIDVIYTPLCVRGLEKLLHHMFASQRVGKREWFRLSPDDLSFLMSANTFDGHKLVHLGKQP